LALMSTGFVNPWLSGTSQRGNNLIVRFVTDDGKIYGSQFSQLSLYCTEPNRLEVTTPPYGVVVIQGVAVPTLIDELCANKATMIRRGGAERSEISSVRLVSEDESVAESVLRAQAEPDEDEL
jgi:hypothetical protein